MVQYKCSHLEHHARWLWSLHFGCCRHQRTDPRHDRRSKAYPVLVATYMRPSIDPFDFTPLQIRTYNSNASIQSVPDRDTMNSSRNLGILRVCHTTQLSAISIIRVVESVLSAHISSLLYGIQEPSAGALVCPAAGKGNSPICES